MKYRVGFVSNSSSTGFLFIGANLTEKEWLKRTGVDASEDDWEEDYVDPEGVGYHLHVGSESRTYIAGYFDYVSSEGETCIGLDVVERVREFFKKEGIVKTIKIFAIGVQ